MIQAVRSVAALRFLYHRRAFDTYQRVWEVWHKHNPTTVNLLSKNSVLVVVVEYVDDKHFTLFITIN